MRAYPGKRDFKIFSTFVQNVFHGIVCRSLAIFKFSKTTTITIISQINGYLCSYSPEALSWNLKSRVDVPRPPDLVCNTTGPEPFQAFVTTTSLAGLWYSSVEYRSQPQTVIYAISSFEVPRLQPRTVIRVPPDEGPDFGESPVISGARLADSTWPKVGARRGLNKERGAKFVALDDELRDRLGLDRPESVALKGFESSKLRSTLSSGLEYKFSIDLDPFLEIEAASIEALRLERSRPPPPLRPFKGIMEFHLLPSPAFLKERTQQSMHKSPIAWEFFLVNGIHRRRWATEGICASGKLTVPRESSRSITVNINAAGLETFLREETK